MEENLWKNIQRAERDYHEKKDTSFIRAINLPYWRKILQRVFACIPPITEETMILDVGCGGCGILLAVDKGRKTGIDPLMDFYLEKFTFLREYPIDWRDGKAEDLAGEGSFDLIFIINVLDHVENPHLVLRIAVEKLNKGGNLVVMLNCHNTVFFRNYYRRFFRFIDERHPHHFTKEDVIKMLGNLRLLKAENMDLVWREFSSEYEEKALRKRKTGWGKRMLKWARNPFRYPVAFAKTIFAVASRGKDIEKKSIFGLYLFVFEKT